jgi:aminoglycoside phosphotransferase (APT) family kinase protein
MTRHRRTKGETGLEGNDLPEGTIEWLTDVGGGRITHLERHVARREAWVVDLEQPDGSVRECFLRLERQPLEDDPWSLGKETRIVAALAGTAVPVPKVFARSERPSLTLFERVPGRPDLPAVGAEQQRAVMTEFMGIIASLHVLDPERLDLGDLPRPITAEECALGEVDLIVDRWRSFLADYHDPLITFGLRWLRRHVPQPPVRVSLLQGDTGPVNFLFEGDHVTAVVDWEWGHLGDPMEDLGNICVREFWNPSGGLTGLFSLYQDRSGIEYRRDAVRYYRVQQNVRGMIPIHAVTLNAHPRESLAWYLAYRYVGDRSTCEALAEALGLPVDRPELPDEREGDTDILLAAAQWALNHDVAPSVDQPFAQSRLHDAGLLLACAERRRRHGSELETLEFDDLAGVLGRRPESVGAGLEELDARIHDGQLPDEAVVPYLTRRAYRDEWLWAPAVSLYPHRRWAVLD